MQSFGWWDCYQKGDSFQGPKVGSCVTLGNELSKEVNTLTKQKTLLRNGTQADSSRVREPRRTSLPCGSVSGLMVVVCFLGYFWPVILPVSIFGLTQVPSWGLMHLSAKMDSSVRCSGRWQDILWAGISSLLVAPPKFCQLVFWGSTMLLIRSFCCETIHASDYYCAQPRWAVWVNSSLTGLHQ